jgi:hypothetical protein
MDQTRFTFGAVVFAFLVFITMRGDVPKWRQVLGV